MRYLVIILFLISCAHYEKIHFDTLQKEFLKNNFDKYNYIYVAITDTLYKWKTDSLANSGPYFIESIHNSKLDSLIYFNSDSTRLFTYHLEQNVVYKNSSVDNLATLAGAKINNKWYFFFGPSIVIDRGSYQDSIYAPLTFDELSYLARQHMQPALYQDSTGKVRVYDKWFDFINNRKDWGLPTSSSLEQLDSLILKKYKDVRSEKIDKTELEEIKKEIAASVQPPEPPDTRNWFQKKFGPKKLFETKEWKEYIGNNNKAK